MTDLSALSTAEQQIIRAAGLTQYDVRAKFMLSQAREKIILGPVGSGKTYTTINFLKHCIETKEPNTEGVRETWGMIVRNTKAEMKTTIIADWLGLFPQEKCGTLRSGGADGSMEQTVEYDLEDETKVRAVIQFIGVADVANVNRVMGGNKTWAYFNEVRFISNAVYSAVYSRAGRTPAGHEQTAGWAGVVSDSNMAEPKHWLVRKVQEAYVCGAVVVCDREDYHLPSYLPKTNEEKKRILDPLGNQLIENYESGSSQVFLQPPGAFFRKLIGRWDVNPHAENLDRLGAAYYQSMFSVADKQDDLLQNVACEPKEVHKGVHVYTNFTPRVHVQSDLIKDVSPLSGVIMGADLGWDNCAVFCELQKRQEIFQLRVLAEIPVDESRTRDITKFTKMCIETLKVLTAHKKSKEVLYNAYCEAAATNRSWTATTKARTAVDVAKELGLNLKTLRNITVQARVDLTQNMLGFICPMEKIPRILIDSDCHTLIAALEGGYSRVEQKNNKEQVVTGRKDDPTKNTHSHIANALEYAVQGVLKDEAVLSTDILEVAHALTEIDGIPITRLVDIREIRMATGKKSKIIMKPTQTRF